MTQRNDFAPCFTETLDDLIAPFNMTNGIQTNQNKIRGNAHQDIGVIDSHTFGVHGVEHHRLVIEVRTESLQYHGVRAL